MNTKFKRLLVVVLAVLMCFGILGCTGSDSVAYMDYGTGVDEQGRYNTELYGLNGLNDPSGPDPGVFYVSEEEDPVYGGYYYRYHSSSSWTMPDTDYYNDAFLWGRAAYCDRSKDMYHWEPCGALAGSYALGLDRFDWVWDNIWAPEVIRNPGDGKYYMYFTATCDKDSGIPELCDSEDYRDRFYIGIAVADSPCGPFDLIGEPDEDTGTMLPTINFKTGLGLEHNIPVIDVHPYFDDDGQFYLYFVRHANTFYPSSNACAVVRMKSMAHADYSTVRIITLPGYKTVDCAPGELKVYQEGEIYTEEGGVNEGPFMIKHNGKYYLTYSAFGYTSPGYSVHQAVSDSPMGPFTKIEFNDGNPILDGSRFGDVYGTGHHSMVRAGDELFIVYHRHSSTISGIGWDRPDAIDRVTFVQNSQGQVVMTTNGPSRTLSWLPESISGYKNLAQTASVYTDNGTGVAYLTDSTMTLYDATSAYGLSAESGDVTITLHWDTPVSVSSVMVYNSNVPESAFSKISEIRFKLAEQPSWAKKSYDWAVVTDVPLQSGAWDMDSESYLECVPAVAEFDPIMVTEIQITIKEADRLVEYDIDGNAVKNVFVSEVVVLGGGAVNE